MKQLGILVPVVTPCSKRSVIDFEGLKTVCGDMLKAGCNGIFIAGSSGRGPWFPLKKRIEICYKVRNYISDDIFLYAGCMASGISDMLKNAQAMYNAGADIAVITAPGYFSYSLNEVGNIFLEFAEKSPLPVLIYDIPAFSGMKLDINMVLKLLEHQNIIGLKDSSSDMERFRELVKNLKPFNDKYLLQGKEHLLAESILSGASGIVVSLLHVGPYPFVSLYKAARLGNEEKAVKIQVEITKVMNIMVECFSRRPETSTLFHFLNNCLKARGICENITLEHEGECPGWLVEKSNYALEIFRSAADLLNM